ncbi:allantoinase PuuE [Carnimonas nigrificans]|uniref:allantoinase PuuE n=1 Tax=Carnimonas nigrificans TaxID=64323 RepID=UPI00046FEE60|nr:allantoinase PuuE [Carnimonas nigrificans]
MASSTTQYPRDMRGYAGHPPHAQWPNNAKIAVQFVVNVEEGSENNVLHGDAGSETFLSDIIGAESYKDRHMSMESLYEYGSRAGFFRIIREFEKRQLPLSAFTVAMALERCPEIAQTLVERGDEIVSHGYRWLHYQHVEPHIEQQHMEQALRIFKEITGSTPLGWYTGRDSPNTRRLVVENGSFLYDSDYYGDDLPLWTEVTVADGSTVPHLVVPYTLDVNDMKFASPGGFNCGDQFFSYLRDAFDVLYAEGDEAPKMMSIGLHPRLIGRPGRFRALQRFLDHIEAHDRVWVCKRADIARHWIEHHPFSRG